MRMVVSQRRAPRRCPRDVNNTDTNRNLRKPLFREFSMWNGTMTKPPTPHPTCVVKGVRLLYPSEQYMGFKRTRNEVDNTAVNINGKKIKGKKWVRTDEGSYKVEVGDGKEEEENREETR